MSIYTYIHTHIYLNKIIHGKCMKNHIGTTHIDLRKFSLERRRMKKELYWIFKVLFPYEKNTSCFQ